MENEERRDRTLYSDRDRRGYMGESHHADDQEVSDGAALPPTDPVLTGIDAENPNVNDADAGDSRLVDPGKPRRGDA